MIALFDTNIIIDYLDGYEPAKLELDKYDEIAISVITYMEVLVGIDEKYKQDISVGLNNFTIYQLDTKIIELTIQIRKWRTPKLKLPDAIIFATSQIYGIHLITRNIKDFPPDNKDIIIPYSK
jgi:predicted nucleic acid-binding protein